MGIKQETANARIMLSILRDISAMSLPHLSASSL